MAILLICPTKMCLGDAQQISVYSLKYFNIFFMRRSDGNRLDGVMEVLNTAFFSFFSFYFFGTAITHFKLP